METEMKQKLETETGNRNGSSDHHGSSRPFEEFARLALQHLHLHDLHDLHDLQDLHVGAHRPLCSAGGRNSDLQRRGSKVILKSFSRRK